MNKAKIFAMSLVLLVLTAVSVKAQAGLVIEGNKQIKIGESTTQTITIQNHAANTLGAGTLNITVPDELEFVSASLPATTSGQGIQISIPAITSGSSEVLSIMVSGKEATSNAAIAVSYTAGDINLNTSVALNIQDDAQDKGEVQGKQTESAQLPVTGMDITPIALLTSMLFLVNLRKLT